MSRQCHSIEQKTKGGRGTSNITDICFSYINWNVHFLNKHLYISDCSIQLEFFKGSTEGLVTLTVYQVMNKDVISIDYAAWKFI